MPARTKINGGRTTIRTKPEQRVTGFSGEEQQPVRSGSEHPRESARSTTVAVLIADDEEAVRSLAATVLERAGFLVLPACNGETALEIFRNGGVKVDALLTDVQMGSGINGIALAEHVLHEKPEIAVLVMSGFSEAELLARERNLRFLAKPFTPAKLVEQVRQVLAPKYAATPRIMKNKGAPS